MALATVADVRETGGIDGTDGYLLFRLADDAALNAAVQKALDRAVAYIRDRVSASVYTGSASTNADRDLLFAGAEELAALHFLFLRLKARKVFGTHFSFDSEESARYEELIDNELLKQADLLIGPYVAIEAEAPAAWVLPQFALTGVLDPRSYQTVQEEMADELNEALGVPDPLSL